VGVIGGERKRVCVSGGRVDPVIRRPVLPDAVRRTPGCSGLYTLCRTTIVMAKLSRSACIDTGPVGGPQAHDDAHRCVTGRTAGRERCRGDALRRLASDGMCRHDPPAEGVGREGTAGMEQAAMTDLHAAIGHDVLEAPAEQCQDVEGGGAWACTARLTGGEGDGAVCAAHETSGDASDPEARGGEGCAGGVSVVLGLTVDVPGDVPARWVDVLQPSGCAHRLLPHGAGDGGEGLHGDKAVGSGGPPRGAVLCEVTARDAGVEVGVVLELPAPGRQDTETTRAVRPDATRVCGEPLEGARRGCAHGVGSEARRRAEAGPERLRNGAGAEAVRPGKRVLQGVGEPLLGGMLRTLRAMPMATGMLDALVSPTAWTLREAVAVMSAVAMLDGADGLVGRGGEVGRWGERARYAGAQAVQRSRLGGMPGALA
jgi:hypothetical protein